MIASTSVVGTNRTSGDVRLESASGGSLFQLAHGLNAVVPLRIEMASKVARGHDLAGHAKLAAPMAAPINVNPAMSVRDCFAAIAQPSLAHVLASADFAYTSDDPEGIHQLRVAIRRMRAAFSVFRSAMPALRLLPSIANKSSKAQSSGRIGLAVGAAAAAAIRTSDLDTEDTEWLGDISDDVKLKAGDLLLLPSCQTTACRARCAIAALPGIGQFSVGQRGGCTTISNLSQCDRMRSFMNLTSNFRVSLGGQTSKPKEGTLCVE
jgi:hypothetical protein